MRARLMGPISIFLLVVANVIFPELVLADASKERELIGEVVSVLNEKNQILVRGSEKGKTVNKLFTVTRESALMRVEPGSEEGVPVRLDNVVRGSQVQVRFIRSRGKNLIRRLALEP